MREGKFFENKKERTNLFIERGPGVDQVEFDKWIFDYQKQRQRRNELAKLLGVAEFVKEPSLHQEKIILVTLRAAEEVINEYSPRPVRLSKSNIFLIRREDAVKRFGVGDKEAGRSNNQGGVFVYTSPTITDSKLAHSTAHELTHHAAFQRVRTMREASGESNYSVEDRGGLMVGHPQNGYDLENGGSEHFLALNEAVTEQIAIEIVARVRRKSRLLDADYDILQRVYGKISSQFSLGKDTEHPESDAEYSYADSYADRVNALRVTCQDLYERNRERFVSPQEVFRVFAEAYFSGKLLPLARLIEKTYGKGAFRFIADYENNGEWYSR